MSTLSTNQIVVEYIIKEGDIQKAQQNFDKLSNAEKQAIVQTQKLNQTLKETGTEGKKATDQVAGGLGNIGGMAGKLGPLIAGAFSIGAIISFNKQVMAITGEFERFSAVLKNSLGSNSAAYAALTQIKDFAAKTPFSVQELTDSFIRLANQGFTPTANQMKRLGDLASSTGKSFNQLAEAIIDAQTGEFERLKEFGVRAEKAGDKVRFTFKGVQTQTEFTNDAIRNYILSLGELEGVAGSMAAISGTLEGQISNLGDSWDRFLLSIGSRTGIVYKAVISGTTEFLNTMSDLFETDAQKLKDRQGKSFTQYSEAFKKTSDEALKNIIANSKKYRQTIIAEDEKAQVEYNKIKEKRKAAGQSTDGNFFSRRTAVKELQDQLDLMKEANKKRIALIGDYQAQEDAAMKEIENRNKATTSDPGKLEKISKQEYEIRLRNLERLKQIREIELTLQGVPEASLIAEKEFLDRKYELQVQYVGKVQSLTKIDLDLTKKQAEKNLLDLNKYYEGLKMVNKTATADFAKDNTKVLDAERDAGIIRMKNWSKMYEANLADEVKAKQKAEKEKAEASKMYYDLVGNSVQSLFQIQQQNIQNEIAALSQKYDNEIRLAGDNEQKVMELKQKQQQEEKALRTKAFEAQRQAAIAEVIFRVAPIIAQQIAGVITAPLAIASYATAAAQIAFIAAQPVPEFKEGTKGKPFKGGKAIVGEIGKEWVVTTSGQVYETPGVATLVDLPKGSQVIPHNEVIRAERYMGSKLMREGRGDGATGQVVERLMSIENTLSKLPITSLTMDERGFTKKIQTKSRETRILNNRFGN